MSNRRSKINTILATYRNNSEYTMDEALDQIEALFNIPLDPILDTDERGQIICPDIDRHEWRDGDIAQTVTGAKGEVRYYCPDPTAHWPKNEPIVYDTFMDDDNRTGNRRVLAERRNDDLYEGVAHTGGIVREIFSKDRFSWSENRRFNTRRTKADRRKGGE